MCFIVKLLSEQCLLSLGFIKYDEAMQRARMKGGRERARDREKERRERVNKQL